MFFVEGLFRAAGAGHYFGGFVMVDGVAKDVDEGGEGGLEQGG